MSHPLSLFEPAISEYLIANKGKLLDAWDRSLRIDSHESNLQRIKDNGNLMYNIVIRSFTEKISDEELKMFAEEVAQERVSAKINIGDFVYNVSEGRNIIFSHLLHLQMKQEDYIEIYENLNDLFDRFIYFSVNKYTEIKDQELKEKMLFIQDTHKDRLTLLGQMSSSFVHEFRNPLTSVMGFIKLIKAGYMKDLYIDTIERELLELNFRITQFLHTSKLKPDNFSFEEVNIQELLDDLIQFLYSSLVSQDIEVIKNEYFNIKIIAIQDEIRQVLLNLLMNAIEALKSNTDKPFIQISCTTTNQDITLKISNNGPEIPEKSLKTIFEPFYTTKELGTGIGLFVCRKIIEEHHGGKLSCQSTNHLTTFTITLPIKR